MHQADAEKITFVIDQGIYFFTVMPFRLKNAGATYQWLVNNMFRQLIGKTIKVYVDAMLTKSLKAEDHVRNLKQTFDILREHQMKLNPKKCAFRVSSGNLFGFI